MDEVKRYVGIDVAKAQLDVFIRPSGERLSVAKDEVGVRRLLEQLGPSDFVILEATGGLEIPVAGALAIGGTAVAVVKSSAGAGLCSRNRAAGKDRSA
jgi:transposase